MICAPRVFEVHRCTMSGRGSCSCICDMSAFAAAPPKHDDSWPLRPVFHPVQIATVVLVVVVLLRASESVGVKVAALMLLLLAAVFGMTITQLLVQLAAAPQHDSQTAAAAVAALPPAQQTRQASDITLQQQPTGGQLASAPGAQCHLSCSQPRACELMLDLLGNAASCGPFCVCRAEHGCGHCAASSLPCHCHALKRGHH